jgi:WhiB family redox-sensing transcriptional regulator
MKKTEGEFMRREGTMVEKINTSTMGREAFATEEFDEVRRESIRQLTGESAIRSAQFITAYDFETSTLGPVRQTGPKNQFVYAEESAQPVPRVVENDPLSWQANALCAQTDPEAFFPENDHSTRDAKRVCASCDVQSDCLDYALRNDERFGVWGGLTERERRKLTRRN